ncbi:MAG: ABC transporter substrate-binding protein [Capsulimonas sp.]|uniref:ABC transporter substrate-binding protein n=1 Tax=Capsulimonas sp. TaxID=2494211 RepID=UPI0032667F8A
MKRFISLILLVLMAAVYGFCAPALAASGASKRRVLVVKSRDIAFYAPSSLGFIKGLKSRGYGDSTDIAVIALSGDKDKDQQTIKSQMQKNNSLIFTLGTDATRTISEARPTCPCVFSMILDPISLGVAKSLSQPGGSFTGTTLQISAGKQLDSLQQILPQIHKVGLLYTDGDATSLAFLSAARQDADRLHIEIVAQAMAPGADRKAALEDLAGTVGAFWLIVDPASAGPQALADTFEIAKQHKLPVLGTSSANVHAGALLALSANLQDLGDVNAEMAAPLLDGSAQAGQTSVRGPRQTMLSVSLDTAAALGLTVPNSVLRLADEVVDSGAAKK